MPEAAWIKLERYDWRSETWMVKELGGDGAVLDIGCGYGCSSAPFARAGREVVGIDENLLFLLLFGRYAREHGLAGVGYACVDAARLPLPFAERSFGGVLAASFFNHYACQRGRGDLREFLAEAARVTEPGGGFVADMVPNRLHPFPTEVNLEVIAEVRLRRVAKRWIRRVPLRWLPGRLTVAALWASYRAYCGSAAGRHRAGRLPPPGFEGAAGSGRGRAAAHRARMARPRAGFSSVKVIDNSPWARGTGPRVPYFVLSCRR